MIHPPPGWDSAVIGLLEQCTICAKRPAKFRFREPDKSGRDHDICMQCFRRQRQANIQKQKFAVDPQVAERKLPNFMDNYLD